MMWVCIVCGGEVESPGKHEGCPATLGHFLRRETEGSGQGANCLSEPKTDGELGMEPRTGSGKALGPLRAVR